MFRNYFKLAIRNLRQHAGYTFINVTGLSVGIACCMLIALFVQDEISFDGFHANADRLYRVNKVVAPRTGGTERDVITSGPMGPALAMHRWLSGFAYHVELSWWIFPIAGIGALGIALVTVSYQSVRAALADPVVALRYE